MELKSEPCTSEQDQPDLDFTDFSAAGASTLNPDMLVPDASAFLVDALSADALHKTEIGFSASPGVEYRIAYARGPRTELAGRPAGVVIVLEDDITTSKVIETVLKKEGYSVRCSSTMNELIAALGIKPLPQLIVMSLMLPDVSGFDILTRLKRHAVVKSIPVLVLTGLADNKSLLRAIALGADGYLTKPTYPRVLLQTMHTILGIASTREAV